VSSITLTWLGQAGFILRGDDATVLVDPFLSPMAQRLVPPPLQPSSLTGIDLVLCTHEHWDHFDGPTVAAVADASPQARILVPTPIVDQAIAAGVPADRVVGAAAHEPLTDLPALVTPVPACHGIDVADAYNFGDAISGGATRYLGYVVDFAGVRAYHAGDTIWWPGLEQALRDLAVHVALLPINGRDPVREAQNVVGNLDHREAALLAAAAGIELLVPMHWDMFAANRGFPDQLVAVIDRLDLDVATIVPRRMRPFVFTPAS
jgi:L-ascorbate 6-phosphate lactonase